jgi:hypothetical protein
MHPVVQIPNLENYFPGKGCMCSASSEWECACDYVDWTPREVYELRAKLQIAMVALIRLRDCDWVISLPDSEIYHLNPKNQTGGTL